MTGPPPSHHRFSGEPIDLTTLDALALGDLWAVAHSVSLWENNRRVESLAASTAWAVLGRGREMKPAFRGAACRDYLDLLAREAEAAPEKAFGTLAIYTWRKVCFALRRCTDLAFDGLGPAAKRFLAAADWRAMPHLAVALARLVGGEFEAQALEKLAGDLAGSPLLVDELRAVAALDLPAILAVADVAYPDIGADASATDDTHYSLSDYPNYVAFAETGLKQAAAHVRKIHDSELPYAPDKAFTLEDSAVIARLARVALDRDEPWLPSVLDEMFRKVSLAPTAAKTVPSQSVAIALGHAVEAFPTPEAVATLRHVLRDLRHAGVEKKLQRNLRGAERGLAERPEIALRLPFDQPISKSQLTTLTRCLEAGLALSMVLDYDDWRVRLAEHASLKALTGTLVWRILGATSGSTAVLPVLERDRLTLRDVAGTIVQAGPGSRVTLWHPSDASAEERSAWRDRLAALRIKQPFKQVFREHYPVPPDDLGETTTAMFSGHIVSIVPFLGLARRERWRLKYDCLARSFGRWTAQLTLADPIYPGCVGATTTGNLSVSTSGGMKSLPARPGDLPAATFSEILRAVDLLVSTSGFAVTAEDEERHREARLLHLAMSPPSAMTEVRKQALECALCGLDGMAGLEFDARHLRLGAYAIHLTTGRVTCAGEPVTIDVPKRSNLVAVPWLPHDEKLLEMICYTAIEIARRGKS
ncbi:DUF4132 domain-containing protein [Aliidongia dinghuensis]|nr:DUF4132 domain-containing protein [Aliidongia dinghuensis]